MGSLLTILRANTPKRAILYARFSTAEQAESGLRIDAQRNKTRSYAELYEWDIIADETEAGVSGTIAPDHRPVLGRLLTDLDSGQADVMVVSHLDRIGRNAADILALADRSNARGGTWSSSTYAPTPPNPSGAWSLVFSHRSPNSNET